ncbi:serine/threonine-protein kinase LATS1-like, partial [Petromyzon marinus]
MLVGQPPFLAPTPAETQLKVVNWRDTLRVPQQAGLSAAATDLCLSLCRSERDRLGGPEVRCHRFLATVDFERLRRSPAPLVPRIAHPTDTSNFDPVEPSKLRGGGGGGSGSGSGSSDFGGCGEGREEEEEEAVE